MKWNQKKYYDISVYKVTETMTDQIIKVPVVGKSFSFHRLINAALP